MSLDMSLIKEIREETGAGILDVKKALDKFEGNVEKAKAELKKKGLEKAATKSERIAKDGLVYAYIHNTHKVGALVAIKCETDFVARTEDFKKLCHEIALQVSSGEYDNVEELLNDDYIKDGSKKIKDLIMDTIAKVGENITVSEFSKLRI